MRVLKKVIWPIQLKYNLGDYREISWWCDANIGKWGTDWCAYSQGDRHMIAFRREDDSIAFRLKWRYNGN